jgi:hypothetical protein
MATKDKDIGLIWKRLNEDCYQGEVCEEHGDMFRLIRSLVDERTKRWEGIVVSKYKSQGMQVDNIDTPDVLALKDFGIDPLSWAKNKGR